MKTREGSPACGRPANSLNAAGLVARCLAILTVLMTMGLQQQLAAAEPFDDQIEALFTNASATVGFLVQESSPADADPPEAGDVLDDVASRSIFKDRKTSLEDGRFSLPPIEALTTDTKEIGNGEVPVGFGDGESTPPISLPETGVDRGLPWDWMTRCWAAPNTFSHPLYFEDRMLERHGHQCHHPALQPAVSGGRFLAQSLMLPYLSAINPPCECVYTLGYYRAGNCVPAFKQRPPYKRKAVVAQAVGVGTAVAILP